MLLPYFLAWCSAFEADRAARYDPYEKGEDIRSPACAAVRPHAGSALAWYQFAKPRRTVALVVLLALPAKLSTRSSPASRENANHDRRAPARELVTAAHAQQLAGPEKRAARGRRRKRAVPLTLGRCLLPVCAQGREGEAGKAVSPHPAAQRRIQREKTKLGKKEARRRAPPHPLTPWKAATARATPSSGRPSPPTTAWAAWPGCPGPTRRR